MSLPAGHNPNASMLQGGEGVNIAPNQAGGGDSMLKGGEDVAILPSQAGGTIETYEDIAEYVLTSEEQAAIEASANFNDEDIENIKGAAITAGILAKDAQLPDGTDTKQIALKAAGIQALKTLNLNQQNEAGAMPSAITDAEFEAARIAKELAEKQGITDPKSLKEIQIKAILIQRKKDNYKIQQVKSQAAPAAASPDIIDINSLNAQQIYTEFYHLFKPDDDAVFDNYESMIATKSTIVRKVVENDIPKDVYTDVKKYKDQRLKMWNNVYQPTGKKVAPIIPIIGGIDFLRESEVITKYSRLAYCLPYNIERVIVIPPIMGNINLFKMTLYRLEKIGVLTHKTVQGKDKYRIKNGVVIGFMPLFYDNGTDENPIYNNMLLFSIFVDIHANNPNKIFILSESTTANYSIGTTLSSKFKNNPSDINNNNAILTMLEPSYIIYPYARDNINNGFIISASKENEMGNMPNLWFSMNDLKLSKLYGQALGFAVKPSAEHKVLYNDDIFVIRSSVRHKTILQIDYEEESTSACEGLLRSPNISEVIKYNPFYLTKVKTRKEGIVDAIMVIQLNPKGEHIPLCKLQSDYLPLGSDDKHKYSDNANAAVPSVQIDIKGHAYSIRISDNTVHTNWENKEFTKDEADFLNITELTPGVLSGAFKGDWPTKLANFLKVFTTFKCMDDTALLTDQQCYTCRDFLEEINKYLISLKLDKDFQEADFNRYARKLYSEVDLNDEVDLKEATPSDKIAHKMKFGVISPYTHGKLNEGGERRAFITGVNRVTGNYKFYTVSTPLTDDQIADDKILMDIVTNELPKKYRNYTFVY
jgi:hypothetical protein